MVKPTRDNPFPQKKRTKKRIAKETADVLEYGFTYEKRVHPGWKEWKQAIEKYGRFWPNSNLEIKQYFGKWQWIFKRNNVWISIIKINARPFDKKGLWLWEIYSDNKLFEDTERFKTWNKAFEAVKHHFGK
jgi:hypothetical protein